MVYSEKYHPLDSKLWEPCNSSLQEPDWDVESFRKQTWRTTEGRFQQSDYSHPFLLPQILSIIIIWHLKLPEHKIPKHFLTKQSEDQRSPYHFLKKIMQREWVVFHMANHIWFNELLCQSSFKSFFQNYCPETLRNVLEKAQYRVHSVAHKSSRDFLWLNTRNEIVILLLKTFLTSKTCTMLQRGKLF